MASVQYFFRAIQDATYITELDLSNNILGGTSTSGQPGLIPLLARCLAGTGTITNSEQRQQQHGERLILVDCSITRPSCLRQITNAIMIPTKTIALMIPIPNNSNTRIKPTQPIIMMIKFFRLVVVVTLHTSM